MKIPIETMTKTKNEQNQKEKKREIERMEESKIEIETNRKIRDSTVNKTNGRNATRKSNLTKLKINERKFLILPHVLMLLSME